jgi:glyoxylase-like metal-dependent hydrolase (beta-lactamase superfamily II)
MHPAELPIATGDFSAMVEDAGPLDRWVVLPMLRLMGRRRREAIIARSSLASVARVLDLAAPVPGMTGWSCIPTPGHTPGHTSFFRPADGVLISGDALVTLRLNSLPGLLLKRQGLSGPPWYTTWSVAASKASIKSLIALSPKVLAGGHGMPRTDAHLASELARFV